MSMTVSRSASIRLWQKRPHFHLKKTFISTSEYKSKCSRVFWRFYPQRSRLWQPATTTTLIIPGHLTSSCWSPPCGSWSRARVWRSPCMISPRTKGRKTGWVLSVYVPHSFITAFQSRRGHVECTGVNKCFDHHRVTEPKVWLWPHVITLMCVFCQRCLWNGALCWLNRQLHLRSWLETNSQKNHPVWLFYWLRQMLILFITCYFV